MKFKGFLHSVMLRYMVSYAAIMAVLFISVGIYVNDNYVKTSRENSVANSRHQLNSIRYQHEEKLETLIGIGSQIGLSPYIKSFQLLEDTMKAFHLLRQLVPYTVTNDFCYQLYLIFHEDNYIYSSATSAELDTFLYRLMTMENTSTKELLTALRNDKNEITILPMQTFHSIMIDVYTARMVTVIVPISIDAKYNVGTLMFWIKEDKYLNMLGYDPAERRNTYIIYQGNVMAESVTMDIDDSAILAEIGMEDGEVEREIVLDDTQYLLIAEPGAMFNMQYVTLIPMETLWNEIAGKQLGVGLFLFLLSIPCMALTIFFSRRHAKPIKELRYLFPSSLSGKDDLETIQSGIEALVGRNRDLNEKISQSLPVQRSAFVRDLVKGRYPNRNDAIHAAAEVGMDIDKAYYIIALIGVPSADGYHADVMACVLCSDETVSGFGTELVALEQHMFVFFADHHENIETWLKQVQEQIRQNYENSTIATSGIHHHLSHLGAAYLEASAAYDNRFLMGSDQVLRFKDVNAAAKDFVPFTRSYLDGFRSALRSGNKKELGKRIDELMQYLKNTEMSLFAFRMIYNNIIAALLDERLERDKRGVDAGEYYDIFTLSNCHSIADLDDLLRKLCRRILSGQSETDEAKHPIIREIAVYIQQNFTEPMLQMSAIADAFNISAASLSLDFKEAMGMSPSDYVLLLRMEKAKEMLRESTLSVKEIGMAVGYQDASGFIRRFRQYLAMTPAQYRQMTMDQKGTASGAGAMEKDE